MSPDGKAGIALKGKEEGEERGKEERRGGRREKREGRRKGDEGGGGKGNCTMLSKWLTQEV